MRSPAPWIRPLVGVATALFLVTPAGARAADPSPAPAQPSRETAPADSTPAEAPPDASSTPRATRTGMWIGGITGAAAGAALFPLGLAIGESLGNGSEDYGAGSYILAGVAGAVLCGLAGAGIGALIGSAFPGKSPDEEPPSSPAPSPVPEPRRSPPARHFGSLSVTGGVDALTKTEYTTASEAGMSVEVALLAHFYEGRFSVGAESGYSWVANGLFNLGGVAQVQLTDEGLRPYGVFAMGWDNWSAAPYPPPPPPAYEFVGGGASLLRAGVGAGLRVRLGSGRAEIQMESRYNWPLQHIDEPGDFSYLSVTLGPRFSW